jgi:hypothetical protein
MDPDDLEELEAERIAGILDDRHHQRIHQARRLVSALVAHYNHHTGQTDWNALADWLATNWGNRQWRSLAHVSRLPEPDPNVQRTALAMLRQVDTPGATTRRELIAADTARRTPKAAS